VPCWNDALSEVLVHEDLRVDLPLVGLQVAYPGESLPTYVAAVRVPGVHPLVLLQVARLREHLATRGAAEGLLPRVDALVDLQLLGSVEGLPAEAADEQPLPARRLPRAARGGSGAGVRAVG